MFTATIIAIIAISIFGSFIGIMQIIAKLSRKSAAQKVSASRRKHFANMGVSLE